MVDRYLSPKLGVNPLEDFRQNRFYTRTDDGRPHHDSNSAVQWNKAELSKIKVYYSP